MKILHILDHSIPLHSGYTFRTRAILQQQRRMHWETFHVTSTKHTGAKAAVEEIDGLQFYRSAPMAGALASYPVIDQWAVVKTLEKRLDEIVPQIKPDILHAHSPALNGMAALAASRKHGIPLVYECRAFWEDAAVDHGTTAEGSFRYRATRWLETRIFKQAHAVTTICEGLRKDIVARGVPAGKVTVIPNAVDTEKFSFGAPRDESLLAQLKLEGKVVLGFIGSFYAYEGLLLLLEALPDIVKARPETRLLLVGGGPQLQQIEQRVSRPDLRDVVVLVGRVPHAEVQRYYQLVDLLVYPRLAMRLTELVTPLKPLEAMAQGKLLIASDVGGHHELIRDRETGYLFQADDKAALSRCVLDALQDQGRWESMRQAGRHYVESERNWANSVARYADVYAGALKASG